MRAATAPGSSLSAPTASASVRVTAVMPCLNEERTVGRCIEKAQASFRAMGLHGEVIIADNGSSDRSVEIATALGARVVHVATKGYGAALTAGIEAARGDYVIMADSDDSYDWLTLDPFVQKLDEGYDLVIGNRFQGGIETGAMPRLHRYLGNPVLSWIARTVHNAPIGDFHCGMRAFRREAFARMNVRTTGMEFATELIVNSAKVGLRIAEVPTRLNKDGRNRRPHLRSFRDGWRHLRFILTYGPNFLYFIPGAAMLLAGLALVIPLATGPAVLFGHYFGIHFLALGSLLTLLGVNVLSLGLFAKVIAAQQSPGLRSRVMEWILRDFTLEGGLAMGALLALVGIAIDGHLLWSWLRDTAAPMNSSIHSGFVATLLIVVGANVLFGSFLLNMLAIEERERHDR
jgi:glycosyltransferase involved in cell wall biosynthesis